MKLSDYWFSIYESKTWEQLEKICDEVKSDDDLSDSQKDDVIDFIGMRMTVV